MVSVFDAVFPPKEPQEGEGAPREQPGGEDRGGEQSHRQDATKARPQAKPYLVLRKWEVSSGNVQFCTL